MISRVMGVAYTIIFLWLALNVQGGFCLSEFHGILTEKELHSYTKKAQIKEYDIILPLVHGPSKVSKRSVDSANLNEAHKVTFTAFDEEHHVVLEENRWLLRPDLEVEYLQPDGSIRKEPVQTRDCHFFATSISHTGSTGALSTCSGLRGVLSVADEVMYIEPLKEHHTKRMKRSSEDAVQPHIIYKRSASTDDVTLCPVEPFTVASNSASANGTVIPANETVYMGPYLGAKFLEIFYVVDSLVYDEYASDTESYAMTILNIMSRRYADPSLDISMRISVVRLLISMTETLTADNTTGSPVTMTPTNNGDTTLADFCSWQAAQSVNDDMNPDDWDLAMLFTGHDIASNGVEAGLLGIALLGGACDLDYKCSINENYGLGAGLVMAHETGHSLGVNHDGDYGCTPRQNIMSASLSLSSGAFEWSSCSSEHMKIFISTEVCMDDVPISDLSPINDLPSQRYSADMQCQIDRKNSTAFSCTSLTNCTLLYCGLPGTSSCSTKGLPAEGTPCGEGMWCINAECVDNTLNVTIPVDGGWTDYGNLSSCSRTCGTGVQFQSRTCTNPSPQWGGMPCVGESHIYMLCNEEWCINAECVNNTLNVTIPVDGGWTEYGNLSSCSRTCGTGVQFRSRTCTNPNPQWGGMPCVGESHIYMLCNEEPCATSQDDFRDEQCAATNAIPLNGNTYSWLDDSGDTGNELCKLNCRAQTGPSSSVINDRPGDFCDGTQCWDDDETDVKSTKLCISGRCQKFGCDGVLNSNTVYDDCRVCGGDGSSCNCTTGVETTRVSLEAVYATIPIGSTSITADAYGDNMYVGLRVNGTFIFGVNGSFITLPGRYTVGNMVVDFDFTFSVESHLRSLTEPSTETLDILVWAGSSALNFTYRYCTPAPIPTPSSTSTLMMSTTSMEGASTAIPSTSEISTQSMTSMPTTNSVMATPISISSDSPSSTMSTSTPTSESSTSLTPMPSTDSVSSTPMSTSSDSSSTTMDTATPISESATSMTSMPPIDSVSSDSMSTPSDSSLTAMSTATPTSESATSMTSMPLIDSVSSTPMSTSSDSSSNTMSTTTATPTPSPSSSGVVTTSIATPMPVIDPCDAAPCQNGGTCTSSGGTYTCTCPISHTGTDCETEIDPCLSSPCENGGSCSSSNAVYLCACPDTHEGTNCETAKAGCSSNAGCPTRESCNSDTNVCECSGNSMRNANGVCRVPRRTLSLSIVIVEYQSNTDFGDIVNNPTSVESMNVRQRLTIIIFAIYRNRYGSVFIGVVIRGFSLGSLEVEADLLFDEPESPMTIQPPTTAEAAQLFTESLENGNSAEDFRLDPSRTTVTDMDECFNSTLNDCSPYAECTNTQGSFSCACQEGFIDTTPAPDIGRQCEVESGGLSGGALAGIVIGVVVIVFLIFFIFVALLLQMRRTMSYNRKLARSISRLAPLDREREAMPIGNGNGYHRDGYPLAHYTSDMQRGQMRKPGYSNGAYTSKPYYNKGFIRPYVAPSGKNESVHDQYYGCHQKL